MVCENNYIWEVLKWVIIFVAVEYEDDGRSKLKSSDQISLVQIHNSGGREVETQTKSKIRLHQHKTIQAITQVFVRC